VKPPEMLDTKGTAWSPKVAAARVPCRTLRVEDALTH
jgi:hypothetical protein